MEAICRALDFYKEPSQTSENWTFLFFVFWIFFFLQKEIEIFQVERRI
jgi:hypothetical protein